MQLTELDHLPDGILERPASALHQLLDGPTLIHLEGRVKQPLFVSVLQHGNEVTGWEAVRRLLKSHYAHDPLPRTLSLLIGNVAAARHRLRRLEDQLDYNRCWPGSALPDNDTSKIFRQVFERMRVLQPMASVDIHNNTGLNPHYAAINRIDNRFLRLASHFSSKVVYFTRPRGTLANAFADLCPSVTLECGLAGDVHGTDHSMAFLESCLHAEGIRDAPVDAEAVHLFHTVATVRVPDDVLFGFGQAPAEVRFPEHFDRLNFTELDTGTPFARVEHALQRPLLALDNEGRDVTDRYFMRAGEHLVTARPVMPSMLTVDRRVVRQDCLGYLMERLHFETHEAPGDDDPLPEALARSDRPGDPTASADVTSGTGDPAERAAP